MSGQFYGRDLMLRWARNQVFGTRVLASAHLYFGILKGLEEIIDRAREVVCISDRGDAVRVLQARYPSVRISQLPVGTGAKLQGHAHHQPNFLLHTRNALRADLRGHLYLVGAGPWAKIYCGWIKRRGGVAVDLGSGFDLLAGKLTRSIHKEIPKETLRQLSSSL